MSLRYSAASSVENHGVRAHSVKSLQSQQSAATTLPSKEGAKAKRTFGADLTNKNVNSQVGEKKSSSSLPSVKVTPVPASTTQTAPSATLIHAKTQVKQQEFIAPPSPSSSYLIEQSLGNGLPPDDHDVDLDVSMQSWLQQCKTVQVPHRPMSPIPWEQQKTQLPVMTASSLDFEIDDIQF